MNMQDHPEEASRNWLSAVVFIAFGGLLFVVGRRHAEGIACVAIGGVSMLDNILIMRAIRRRQRHAITITLYLLIFCVYMALSVHH
jgi:drug/metabolite transporter (DMT)-like permease